MSRLVQDHEARGDRQRAAITMRWRWPPLSSWAGACSTSASSPTSVDATRPPARSPRRGRCRRRACTAARVRALSDRLPRVQRAVRVLEDDLDPPPEFASARRRGCPRGPARRSRIRPALGSSSLASSIATVLLPQPDSPTSPNVRPGPRPRDRRRPPPRTTTSSPREQAAADREMLDQVAPPRARAPRSLGRAPVEVAGHAPAPAPARPAPASIRAQASSTRGQRGWNRHPAGGSARAGIVPGIGRKHGAVAVDGGDRLQQRLRVGMPGARKKLRASALSTTLPAYITATRSASCATMPMSWVISSRVMSMLRRSSESRLRICACTVTSSAVVISSAITRCGRRASAIAMTAALLHAAGQLEGILPRRSAPDPGCGPAGGTRCS